MDKTIMVKTDILDAKIIALFERRMALSEKAAANMTKRELRREVKKIGAAAAEKTTSFACDASVIAYTEELVKLILCAACKHQRRMLERKEKCGRG